MLVDSRGSVPESNASSCARQERQRLAARRNAAHNCLQSRLRRLTHGRVAILANAGANRYGTASRDLRSPSTPMTETCKFLSVDCERRGQRLHRAGTNRRERLLRRPCVRRPGWGPPGPARASGPPPVRPAPDRPWPDAGPPHRQPPDDPPDRPSRCASRIRASAACMTASATAAPSGCSAS